MSERRVNCGPDIDREKNLFSIIKKYISRALLMSCLCLVNVYVASHQGKYSLQQIETMTEYHNRSNYKGKQTMGIPASIDTNAK